MESHKNFDQVRLCTRNKPTMFPVIFVYFYGNIVYEDFCAANLPNNISRDRK